MAAIAPRRDATFQDPAEGLLERMGPRARRAAAVAALLAIGAFWGAAVGVAGASAAIVCVALIASIFCLRDFRAGVAMLIVIMPIAQSYLFPHAMFGVTGMNPLNLLMLATLAAFAMRTAGEGALGRFVPAPVLWLYVVPLGVGAAIGAPHAAEIPAMFRNADIIFFDNASGYLRDMYLKPLGMVVYALLVAQAVERSQVARRFITPTLASVFVMASVVLVFAVAAGISLAQLAGTYERAFFSPLGMHANDLGRLYATAYALLLFTWDRGSGMGLRALLVAAMGFVVLALLLTFSRGAFFAFIVVNLVYLFSRRRLKTLLLAALLVPAALALMPGAVWSRMTMGFGEGLNTISAGRVGDIWAPLVPTLLDSPVWGNGLGSIMWSRPMVDGLLPAVAHPHNAYLQLYMDTGIVGFLLVMAFWLRMWAGFRGLRRDARILPEMQGFFEGAAAGLLAFFIAGFAGSSLQPAPEQAFLWLAVGMLFGVRRKLERHG